MAEIYPDRNPLTLRQEALNRVREMQRRAQLLQQNDDVVPPSPSERSPDRQNDTPHEQNRSRQPPNNIRQQPNMQGNMFGRRTAAPPSNRPGQAVPDGIADLLKRQGMGERISGLGETVQNTVSSVSRPLAELLESFGIDGEKLIILMVMWAVFNQNKDNKALLMALGYILL